MGDFPFDLTLDELSRRRSAKWTQAPRPGLPMWVAEMDVRLAEPVAQALHAAVEDSDTGYGGDPAGYLDAFAGFARERWGWSPPIEGAAVFPDLAAAGHFLFDAVAAGGGVVITPPVYSSFPSWLGGARVRQVDVPLLTPETGGRLDLAGIDAALRDGARAVLISHPQNPTGGLHAVDDLAGLAEIADRHGAVVVSDEIHAPLTHPGHEFVPFLTVSDAARRVGISLQSASKAWNLAGLKASMALRAPEGPRWGELQADIPWSIGHFGLIAGEAAYRYGAPWLDLVVAQLAVNADRVAEVLADRLPAVGYQRPRASFLAWLDLRALDLGDDPSAVIAERAGIVPSPGPSFGVGGAGWARLNIGTPPEVLDEALDRLTDAFG